MATNVQIIDPDAGEHGGKSLDLFCIKTTYFYL